MLSSSCAQPLRGQPAARGQRHPRKCSRSSADAVDPSHSVAALGCRLGGVRVELLGPSASAGPSRGGRAGRSRRTDTSIARPRSWLEKETPVASLGDTPPSSLRDVRYCVILTQGDDVPPEFIASLARHGIETVLRNHPLLAFADLLSHERGHRQGGWGLPNIARSALIVADRDRWERLDRLLDAVRRELPKVAVWISSSNLLLEVGEVPHADDLPAFPEGPQVRLSSAPLERGGPSPQGPDSSHSSPPTGGSPTHTSIAPHTQADPPFGEGRTGTSTGPSGTDLPAEPDPSPPRNRPTSSASVTPEEIEMLLKLFPDGDATKKPPDPPAPSS